MAVYELNDTVTLTQSGASDDDAQLFVTAPNGTESEPTVAFSAGTGLWSGSVTADQYDQWEFAWRLAGEIVETGIFIVGGPWYVTLAELRHALNIPASNTSHDAALAKRLMASSRAVEKHCDSRPKGAFLLDDTATAKLYRPTTRGPAMPGVVLCTEHGYRLYVNDIGHATFTVETRDSSTASWATLTEGTDFETYPDNALSEDRAIEALVSESAWPAQVRVTARWGWPEVPSSVADATLLQATRLYRRKDSPEGVMGSSDWGLIRVPNLDPDVKALLSWLHTDAMIA